MRLDADVAAVDVAQTLLPELAEGNGSLDVEGRWSRSKGRKRACCRRTWNAMAGQRRLESAWSVGGWQGVAFPPEVQQC